jgi:hypothetical protein
MTKMESTGSEQMQVSGPAEPELEACSKRIVDLITQKFVEGASIEEIARDWDLELNGPDCVVVPRLLLEIFRYHLSQSHRRVFQNDA